VARVKQVEPRTASEDDLMSQAKEYNFAKKQIEYFEAKAKALREKLFEQFELLGEVDSDGNVFLNLPDEVDGVVSLKKERRVRREINEERAEEIIEEKGLEDQLYKTIQVIDEDALMAALYSDVLTEQEVDEMYPQKVTWALKLNRR
jgi:hypothetical protein